MKRYLTLVLGLTTVIILSSFLHTDRNIIYVLANANDVLLFEHELIDLSDLTDSLKLRINNSSNHFAYPEMRKKKIDFFGEVLVSRAIVSIANDRGTSYSFYIKVQNEIERAYNELRNELAIEKFNKSYKSLSEERRKAINKIFPKRISEAEPRKIYQVE